MLTAGMFIQMLSQDAAYYVSVLAAVVVGVTLHELGHAFAALRQGDDTPRLLGRITLDPMVQMGPTSLIMAALLGIAWGQTPVNPAHFRGRYGDAYVAFAGPLVNLVLALITLTLVAALSRSTGGPALGLGLDGGERNNLHLFLFLFGSTNLLLFLFNMIPVPPLDGATILGNFVPAYARVRFLPEAQPWFFAALIAVVVLVPVGSMAIELAARYVMLWL